jgi:hypothetical protein
MHRKIILGASADESKDARTGFRVVARREMSPYRAVSGTPDLCRLETISTFD